MTETGSVLTEPPMPRVPGQVKAGPSPSLLLCVCLGFLCSVVLAGVASIAFRILKVAGMASSKDGDG